MMIVVQKGVGPFSFPLLLNEYNSLFRYIKNLYDGKGWIFPCNNQYRRVSSILEQSLLEGRGLYWVYLLWFICWLATFVGRNYASSLL